MSTIFSLNTKSSSNVQNTNHLFLNRTRFDRYKLEQSYRLSQNNIDAKDVTNGKYIYALYCLVVVFFRH